MESKPPQPDTKNPDNNSATENGSTLTGTGKEFVQVQLNTNSQTEYNKSQSMAEVKKSIPETQMEIQKKPNWLKRFIQRKSEGLTKRQVMICIIFAFVEFFAATVISIQAPFFPDVVSSWELETYFF